MREPPAVTAGCCEISSERRCVFDKALLARAAECECARRASVGERLLVECGSPVARINCGTLMALVHERARFALRLPPPGRPMIHMQALRLQCGTLAALQAALGASQRDAHRLLVAARQRHDSLADLPWADLVPRVAAWQPARRGMRATPPAPEPGL